MTSCIIMPVRTTVLISFLIMCNVQEHLYVSAIHVFEVKYKDMTMLLYTQHHPKLYFSHYTIQQDWDLYLPITNIFHYSF